MHDEIGDPVYTDETAPTDRRVDGLLSRMTIEEKVPQLGSVNADRLLEDGDPDREAGESRRVTFDVSATQLAFHDRHENLAVEAGDYELRVGHAPTDVVETETLFVTETADVPPNGRRYFTKTAVDEH